MKPSKIRRKRLRELKRIREAKRKEAKEAFSNKLKHIDSEIICRGIRHGYS